MTETRKSPGEVGTLLNGSIQKSAAGRRRSSSRLAWFMLLLILAGLGGTILLIASGCPVGSPGSFSFPLVSGFGFAVLGFLITRSRPENRIGRLCLFIAFAEIIGLSFSDLYARCGLTGVRQLPGLAYLAWVKIPTLAFLILSVAGLLPFWFPDGQFLSPRWRRLGWVSVLLVSVFVLPVVLRPGPLENEIFRVSYPIDNPFGFFTLPSWLGSNFYNFGNIPMSVAVLLAIFSFVNRWRGASGDTRQQLKWLAYYLTILGVVRVVGVELLAGLYYRAFFDSAIVGWLNLVTFTGFPLIIGLAIFKYRLYDIDIIIKRTLVYGVLTGLLAFLYFGSVTLLQGIFSTVSGQRSPITIVISTLFIAALFAPLRSRIQTFIDRRFYRRRYDAARTLAAFALTARDEVDLDALEAAMLQVVQETMQPESVGLWLNATADGRPRTAEVTGRKR